MLSMEMMNMGEYMMEPPWCSMSGSRERTRGGRLCPTVSSLRYLLPSTYYQVLSSVHQKSELLYVFLIYFLCLQKAFLWYSFPFSFSECRMDAVGLSISYIIFTYEYLLCANEYRTLWRISCAFQLNFLCVFELWVWVQVLVAQQIVELMWTSFETSMLISVFGHQWRCVSSLSLFFHLYVVCCWVIFDRFHFEMKGRLLSSIILFIFEKIWAVWMCYAWRYLLK